MRIKKQKPLKRGAGTLLAISSLPSKYGIGNFGKAAYEFVDFLHRTRQCYWQVLPLCPTSYGDSPYQSFSAFAGNPYFIDPDALIEEGLIEEEDMIKLSWGDEPDTVDYATLYENRYVILKAAFSKSTHRKTKAYKKFCEENSSWLDDYSLFMAIKDDNDGISWIEWPDNLRLRDENTLKKTKKQLSEQIDFWKFCQFYFYKQWNKLKQYANENGIMIIGDIPIYVAMDSADVWANPEFYQLDENRMPTRVAGVPPDMFSVNGQLWGNPLYDWDMMEKDDFSWWRNRIRMCLELYDILRIDHFIGIVNFYSIPASSDTAINGEWLKGPGEKLIAAISQEAGDKQIIAEDLGVVTPEVTRLRDKAGYPGMRLYQQAFDSGSGNWNLPSHYHYNIVVYGGTHDNETTVGYLKNLKRSDLKFARDYLNVRRNKDILWAMIRTAYASTAGAVIFQMQDYLELDNSARMNIPSTVGGNWMWRMTDGQITDKLENVLKEYSRIYDRNL